jgi:hypothetical protein
MQTATNTIQKAKVRDSRLEVIYEEYFSEENYSNTIDKKCAQVIHADFQESLDRLKPHLACICEMPEGNSIFDIYKCNLEDFKNYIVTGYSHGGSAESTGITIVGQKLLKSGKVLNLITPFIQFEDTEVYRFANDLSADIDACDHEVKEYLFDEKWGVKQLSLDFDTPEGVTVEVNIEKKKRGRKKKVEINLPDEAA